jgi:hypothetical protein
MLGNELQKTLNKIKIQIFLKGESIKNISRTSSNKHVVATS